MRTSIMSAMTAGTAVAEPPGLVTSARSAWHSPVPYLFGGFAAMLGLIAIALLILACSYWRVYRSLDRNNNSSNDTGEKKPGVACVGSRPVLPEGVVVIMPGDIGPTHLATPMMMTCGLQRAALVAGAPVAVAEKEKEGDIGAIASSSTTEEHRLEIELN